MRLTGNFNEWSVSQTLLSKIFGVSVQRVNKMIDEKIVLRDESSKSGNVLLIDSLKNYYLSKQATDDGGSEANFWKERAKNEMLKRQMNEIKLAKLRGEFYDAVAVDEAFFELLTILKNNLLGIPAKYAKQLENKTAEEIAEILAEEINQHLAEVANFDVTTLSEEVADEDEENLND